MTKPGTPKVTPASAGSFALAITGIIGQFVPITADAKTGIVQIVSVGIPTLVGHDFGLRAARAKYLGELLFQDDDHNPKTPPTLAGWVFPAFGMAVGCALGEAVALALVLT